MDLTEVEVALIHKDSALINYQDHKPLIALVNKLSNCKDKKLFSVCSTRLALSLDRSRIPHNEKARHWETAAKRAKEVDIPSSQLYEFAADYFGRDLGHRKSAELFEESATQAVAEKLDRDVIRRLYQEARRQFELSGNGSDAARIFIVENDYRLSESKGIEKLFLFSYKTLSAYGESPLRVGVAAMVVILGCSLLYWLGGIYSSSLNETINSFPTSLYFSVVTFTTLGYGDYSPASTFIRVVASAQALSGLLLTSLFLVTVVRKYSR